MGKKKNKPNAYFNFMQAMKPIVEKRLGYTIAYEQLNDHVGPEWKSMTHEQRAKYAPNKRNIPLDSYGVPLSVHAEIAEHARKIKEDMENGIRDMMDLHVTGDAMRELEVVVVAVTDYITTEDDQVIPAEVSLVRLTLGGGLVPKQYHAIINPPPAWPLGYAAAARAHVDVTHCLPIDRRGRDCVGTDSLDQVAAEIVAFLTQEDGSARLCPVFTLEERLDITRKVFRQSFGMELVDVWCLENLLRAAFEALYPENSGIYTNSQARNDLVNSPRSPDHHPALGCKWHREERQDEVNHCSLNMAQRWGFMLLNALNVESSLGVTLVVGRHWPGPYHNQGVVIHLAAHDQQRNVRRHVNSMQAIDTTSEGFPDSDTETGSVAGSRADSVASSSLYSKSRREKTWQEIENCPKTPVLQCSGEFPLLGGGRKPPPKSDGRGEASGSSRGACGGPSIVRNKAGECNNNGSDQSLSFKLNVQHASSKGAGRMVSIKNAAACLVAKSNDSSGGRQQGAADKSRVVGGGGGGLPYTAQVEEQLKHVNLNGGPCRSGESRQHTAAFVEKSAKEPSKQNGVNGAQHLLGQHVRPVAAHTARPTLYLSGIGRGRKK